MGCTTILVGKKASYDGSTMIARNDDSGSGHYMPKKFVVVHPQEQPRKYKSVISEMAVEQADAYLNGTAPEEEKQLVPCVAITADNTDCLNAFVYTEPEAK